MSKNTNVTLPSCVVHIKTNGDLDYYSFGKVRMLIIDENAPDDRVYELSSTNDIDMLISLVGNSPIGNMNEEIHREVSREVKSYVGLWHTKIPDDVEH